MKYFKFFMLFVFALSGCMKEVENYILTVKNPFNFDIEFIWDGEEVIEPGAEKVYTFTPSGEKEIWAIEAGSTQNGVSTVVGKKARFNPMPGKSYYWVAGSETVSELGNGDESGDGAGDDSDCSNWIEVTGTCLDTDGERGVHFKICQLGETATEVTVKVHMETINKGIDSNFYSEIEINYGFETVTIPPAKFNTEGFTSPSFTLEKEFYLPATEDVVWDNELKYYVGVATGRGYPDLVTRVICRR